MKYEKTSIEEIEKSLLGNISDDYIKEIGTFTRDLTKSVAIENFKLEEKIEDIYKKLDVNNLFGEELETFVFQRKGIHRKKANSAKGILKVEGTGAVKINDLFETESGEQFKSIENKDINGTGTVAIEAVIPGVNGNVGANTIKFIPITLAGINKVNNETQTEDGYDVESDESLRDRYFIEIQKPATSGNKYHYMQWAREVVGVGDSKIFPLWNGNNTVQVVIIDDNKKSATSELVQRTQNYIDPKGETWGTGSGTAPIGAYCTVSSATEIRININVTVILKTGFSTEIVKPLLEKQIEDYLKSIAFKKDYVSFALLSSWILNVEGIQEWTELSVNEGNTNIRIGEKEVAVLGSVTVNAE